MASKDQRPLGLHLVDPPQQEVLEALAATSIPLNTAEGAGEFAANEKARFYRMAKRSATECAAILDVCGRLELVAPATHDEARGLLLRMVSMLTKLAK